MKYKVGDLVRVRSFDWWKREAEGTGGVIDRDGYTGVFTESMTVCCGKVCRVKKATNRVISVIYELDDGEYNLTWEDWMLEEFVIENVKEAV
jgi:hypothetical protein